MRRTLLNSDRGAGFLEVLALILLFAFGAFVFYGYCQEERITLSTYYPSPFAIYRDLNITRTLNMTAANATSPANGIFFGGPAGGAMIRGWSNRLLIEMSNNMANTIYIGRSAPACGMVIDNSGNVSICGSLYVQGEVLGGSTGTGRGCIILSYGSYSVMTQCPAGYTLNAAKSGAPSQFGGIFYCCK